MVECYTMNNKNFPFSAVVGQEQLKTALIIASINPQIGGVLIRGEKGTAKSTIVRSLSALLPGVKVVTLPLNATEDCVTGGIDFSQSLKKGEQVFQPGLLARAHKQILYVDEVNLLDDHIVDIILDAASTGINRIEREGFSTCHPSSFMLVGTMNPEEGELRPQLLDRFGLCVEVTAETDIEKRLLLMERRETFDTDPEAFHNRFRDQDQQISMQIETARGLLDQLPFSKNLRCHAADLCLHANTAGHRADLVMEQAAKAFCAYCGKSEISKEDVDRISRLVLMHRNREAAPPPQAQDMPEENAPQSDENAPIENSKEDNTLNPAQENQNTEESEHDPDEPMSQPDENMSGQENEDSSQDHQEYHGQEKAFEIGQTFKVRKFTSPKDRLYRRGSGRRSRSRTQTRQGRYIKSTLAQGNRDIAFDATLRAAAPFQIYRRVHESAMAVVLREEDVRKKIREKRIGNFLLFCVDASASMGAKKRMVASKGAIMSLLMDAYQKRDKVAMVTFRGKEGVVNLPPTASVELAGKLLEKMPVGGKTPLSSGLIKTFELLRSHLLREPLSRPLAIIITDGRGNVALGSQKPHAEALEIANRMSFEDRIQFIVVDSESSGGITLGLAKKLADNLGAAYFNIQNLKADQLLGITKGELW